MSALPYIALAQTSCWPPGGFKVWEGSLDLARFLAARWGPRRGAPHSHASACSPPLPSSGKGGVPGRVLELGCGQALPGLVAMLAGAEVHFQVRWHPRPSTLKALPELVAMLAGAQVHFQVRWYQDTASLHPHGPDSVRARLSGFS